MWYKPTLDALETRRSLVRRLGNSPTHFISTQNSKWLGLETRKGCLTGAVRSARRRVRSVWPAEGISDLSYHIRGQFLSHTYVCIYKVYMNVYECIRIYTVYSKYVSIYDMYTTMYPGCIYTRLLYILYTAVIHMYIYTSGKGSILTDANTPQKGLADETARSSDPRHQRLAQRHRQTTLLHYDFKNCVSKMREMRPKWIRTCFSAFATRPPSPPSSPPTTPPFTAPLKGGVVGGYERIREDTGGYGRIQDEDTSCILLYPECILNVSITFFQYVGILA